MNLNKNLVIKGLVKKLILLFKTKIIVKKYLVISNSLGKVISLEVLIYLLYL